MRLFGSDRLFAWQKKGIKGKIRNNEKKRKTSLDLRDRKRVGNGIKESFPIIAWPSRGYINEKFTVSFGTEYG